MAFPTIPTEAASRLLHTNIDGTGTRTFPSLTGLTKNSGDLLIAIVVAYESSSGAGGTVFSSWGGGFTEFTDQMTTNTSTMAIGAAYKFSTGSETGTFTVTQAATIVGGASLILLSIPGAHDTTPPEAGTIADNTAAAADPGSFDPAGWGAEDTLWISVNCNGMTNAGGSWTATLATAPANYTDRVDTNRADDSTVGRVEGAVAFRQLNASSEDVGAGSSDVNNARNSALLIAVRPAAAPPLPDGHQEFPSSPQPWLRRALSLDPQTNRVLTTLAPPALGSVPFSTPVPSARQPSLRPSADATQNLLLTTLIEEGFTVGDSRLAAFQMQSPQSRRYPPDVMASLLTTTLASEGGGGPPDTSLMGQAWM